jgi:anti-sigma factor RsiW
MKCSDVRPLLDLLCDGALETKDSALVLDHLKSCGECQHEWNDLEQLRASFQDAKEKPQLPVGFMERISDKLKDEERSERKRYFAQFASALPVMAIAATVLIIGFFLLSVIHQVDTKSASIQTASADTLVDDLVSAKTLTPVADRDDLARKVGYDLKYLRLPQWQMNQLGVYKLKAAMPIARFDFVRNDKSGSQRLSCYQAPQGTIHAEDASLKNVEGKRVFFGNHGNFQYALWSQNGRDYLFVTALSKPQLEEIVRGT